MRLFAAIEMNDKVRERASEVIEKLKKTGADVKWVERENLHITLKFLGEQPEENLPKIKQSLGAAAAKSGKFNLNVSGAGVFPAGRFPRVVWLGAYGEVEKAKALAKNVDTELSALGIEKEKRDFTSHLTLGRVRSQKNVNKLVSEIENISKNEIGTAAHGILLEVNRFVLYRSKLSPKGPVYTVLERFSLA